MTYMIAIYSNLGFVWDHDRFKPTTTPGDHRSVRRSRLVEMLQQLIARRPGAHVFGNLGEAKSTDIFRGS